jgi:hypothetical protein
MDLGSQNVVVALNALRGTLDELRSFGYKLFLQTKAHGWTQPGSAVSFCGKGHAPAEPALTFGFAIWRDGNADCSIIFSILVAWNSRRWSVQSSVEDEDGSRDVITDTLWESPEYEATTLGGLVGSLQRAVNALTSSVHEQRVAAYLAAIERRT